MKRFIPLVLAVLLVFACGTLLAACDMPPETVSPPPESTTPDDVPDVVTGEPPEEVVPSPELSPSLLRPRLNKAHTLVLSNLVAEKFYRSAPVGTDNIMVISYTADAEEELYTVEVYNIYEGTLVDSFTAPHGFSPYWPYSDEHSATTEFVKYSENTAEEITAEHISYTHDGISEKIEKPDVDYTLELATGTITTSEDASDILLNGKVILKGSLSVVFNEADNAYRPAFAIDDTRIAYYSLGWEWIWGYGIYDTATGENHYYEGAFRPWLVADDILYCYESVMDPSSAIEAVSLASYERIEIPESIRDAIKPQAFYVYPEFVISPDGSKLAVLWIGSRMSDSDTTHHELSIYEMRSGLEIEYFTLDYADYGDIVDDITFVDSNTLYIESGDGTQHFGTFLPVA